MNKPTIAANNPFCIARYKASEYDERLRSRDSAESVVAIGRGKLADIERGLVRPNPDEVIRMADTYNAPELLNHYCSAICPIGRQLMPKADVKNIEQVALNAYMALQNATKIKETIIEIAQDGKIDETERPRLQEALEMLTKITKVNTELQIIVRKLEVETK